ncbi:TRAP-type C4-dicarboxylate transport system permease small subunit [Blastococcus colisei]|uniref:TRAP-type C4-dicarboxylate transport system permease small subunit n=1 Tax=Blastococcus colisei TaxID=1564162 RepID=A0A543PDT5_9ACTN|nr:TRAP transporter small permease subunit [Blastococcus colisei]TQN42235.1 TRAP-type C4-dicarboxylate transport system permease small subunit [Blastococcus colisei]
MSERAGFQAPPRWWTPWVRWITRFELALGAVALVIMFVLVLVQAAQRYLPVGGWSWTGELSRFSLVWLTFTVAGVLVTTDSHIALQLVDSLKKPLVVRAVRVFACATVAVIGVGFAVEAWELVSTQGDLRSPSLRMPLAVLYFFPFLGFVSTAVRGAVAAVVFAVRGVPAAAEPTEVHA